MSDDPSSQDLTLRSIVEGRGMDILAGRCSDAANVCWLCGSRCEGAKRVVGDRQVCIDCFRQVREVDFAMDKREAMLGKDAWKKNGEGSGA